MTVPPQIPDILDEDVEWIAHVMELNGLDDARRAFLKRSGTFDVSACPGSGKTTLVVAKLAIMARKWPHKTSGICVLSHTNVAREEIRKRLGHTPVGHRLLGYPHFIDTIHTFTNRFLALPFLQSNNYPSPIIDDDVAKAFRWKVLPDQERRGFENWLNRKRASIRDITFTDKDFTVALNTRNFPTGVHTDTYQKARRIVEESAQAGRFRYEEMFVWAEHLLECYPEISSALSHRFPLVLMDEMQDTSERQAALLGSIFDRTKNQCHVQRVGDPNQEIFKTERDRNTADPFPDTAHNRFMTIANSRRFGNPIASMANPHAALPLSDGGLRGDGPSKAPECVDHGRNLILIFPDDDASGVIAAFGGHLIETFDDETLCLGDCVAVGGVHNPSTENIQAGHAKYPRSVEHYWPAYRPEMSKSERHPKTLSGYLHQARDLVRSGKEISPAITVFTTGLTRLVRDIGLPRSELGRRRKHKAIRNLLQADEVAIAHYDEFIYSFITTLTPVSSGVWDGLKPALLVIAKSLCEDDGDGNAGNDFLQWENPAPTPPKVIDDVANDANIYPVNVGDRMVSIRLGSIHQAKGQTHFATLLLSTFQNNHSSEKIFDWLCNEKSGGIGEGTQNLSRLKRTYVAMTRPTHLVAVALRNSAMDDSKEEAIAKLEALGWYVKDLCPTGN